MDSNKRLSRGFSVSTLLFSR